MGATGMLLYLFDSPRVVAPTRTKEEPPITPLFGPDSIGAAVTTSF